MQALKEHEHECRGEEVVDEDGEDPAGPRVVVQSWEEQAEMGQNERYLHVHLDHSGKKKRTCLKICKKTTIVSLSSPEDNSMSAVFRARIICRFVLLQSLHFCS